VNHLLQRSKVFILIEALFLNHFFGRVFEVGVDFFHRSEFDIPLFADEHQVAEQSDH